MLAGAVVFVTVQVLLLVVWMLFWRRRRNVDAKGNLHAVMMPATSTSTLSSSNNESLSYIYDSGIPRRYN